MSSSLLGMLRDRSANDRLLDGEYVIDVVVKHWVVYLRAIGVLMLGTMVLVLAVWSHRQAITVPLLVIVLALWVFGGYQLLAKYRDVLYITNMRVFRVTGVFDRNSATMPINRILDFTVHQPFLGRLLGARNPEHGYGHLIFESAAQEQGLREILYVNDPEGRDRAIQQVVQDAGLRGNVPGG